jgi:DNA-binding NtrC family response regulator
MEAMTERLDTPQERAARPDPSTLAKFKQSVSAAQGTFRRRGILVIDDDETFRELLTTVARTAGVPLVTVGALGDMTSFAELRHYDVVVLDYFLDTFRGPEIAEYIQVFFKDLPVIVTSGGDLAAEKIGDWPSCVKDFVPKARGPYALLQSCLDQVTETMPRN